jgi:hypothetical protein
MLNILNDSGTTTQYKICTHCKQSFPKTTEFFYPVKSGIQLLNTLALGVEECESIKEEKNIEKKIEKQLNKKI